MRYKDFEIRPYGGGVIKNKWEVVKWDTSKWYDTPSNESVKSHCFTIAFLIYNDGEDDFEFKSVGTRYLEHADSKLNEIILKWCELQMCILSVED